MGSPWINRRAYDGRVLSDCVVVIASSTGILVIGSRVLPIEVDLRY